MAEMNRRRPVMMDSASRSFGPVHALQDVTLDVSPGTIVGIIGPSGSGKTTAIRLLTGTLAPTSGLVRVLDEDPVHFRGSTRERIGYMPQSFVLYPDLTAKENVDFVAALFGLILWRRYRRTKDVLRLVELWDARGRTAKNMSGGMQRRLALACALVHDPILYFFDEPTAGIDPVLRLSIWDEFRRLRDASRTLVVTTQYVTEAEYCDQVAVIADGRLVALAPPEKLRLEAFGGEPIVIETKQPVTLEQLSDLSAVRNLRPEHDRPGPQHRFEAVTDDAGSATPRIIEDMNSRGVDVAAIHEAIPSFDEVFARLVGERRPDDGNGKGPSAVTRDRLSTDAGTK